MRPSPPQRPPRLACVCSARPSSPSMGPAQSPRTCAGSPGPHWPARASAREPRPARRLSGMPGASSRTLQTGKHGKRGGCQAGPNSRAARPSVDSSHLLLLTLSWGRWEGCPAGGVQMLPCGWMQAPGEAKTHRVDWGPQGGGSAACLPRSPWFTPLPSSPEAVNWLRAQGDPPAGSPEDGGKGPQKSGRVVPGREARRSSAQVGGWWGTRQRRRQGSIGTELCLQGGDWQAEGQAGKEAHPGAS